MPDEQLMNIRQVAEFLQLNQTTVYAWAQQGVLPGFKLGRNWRFRPSEIEAWLEERRQGQTTDPNLKQTVDN
jgi:excisionase family DNA binding protein